MSKLKKKDLQEFTNLVWSYLDRTYEKALRQSLSRGDVARGLETGTLWDLQKFAQLCVCVRELNDPCRTAYAPYLKSDYCIDGEIYDSVVFHHKDLPPGMWKDFFDNLQEEEKIGKEGRNAADEIIVEYLNEETLKSWITKHIDEADFKNYKTVCEAGMQEILNEPAREFLRAILHMWG